MLILIVNEAVFSFEKGSKSLHRFPQPYQKNSPLYTRLPPLRFIWKALIYKVVIVGSLVPAMDHLPNDHLSKCMSCHKTILIINSMAHCFHEYT